MSSDDVATVNFEFSPAAIDAAARLRQQVVEIVAAELHPQLCGDLDAGQAMLAVLGGLVGATAILSAEMLSLKPSGDARLAEWVRDCFAGNLAARRHAERIEQAGCEGSA